MRITPLDIHHKKFRTSFRGYGEEEVDIFLDEVAVELDRLIKENNALKEKADSSKNKIDEYQTMEQTLHHTLVNAQKLADDITEKAKTEADKALKEARAEAAKLYGDVVTQRKELLSNVKRLRKLDVDCKDKLVELLESYIKQVREEPDVIDEKFMKKEDKLSDKLDEIMEEASGEASEEKVVSELEEVKEEKVEIAEKTVAGIDEKAKTKEKAKEEKKEKKAEELNLFEKKGSHQGQSFTDLGEGVPGVLSKRKAKIINSETEKAGETTESSEDENK